jgi:hypothetical protein
MADRSEQLSVVIGRSRIRLPVAWNTASAMAAAVPTMPISPSAPYPRFGAFDQSAQLTSITNISRRRLGQEPSIGIDQAIITCDVEQSSLGFDQFPLITQSGCSRQVGCLRATFFPD